MLFNVTVDETGWEKVRPYLASFAGKIPAGPTGAEADIAGNLLTDMKIPEYEGLIVPSQINYVGKGTDIYRSGYKYHGSIGVITRYLRTSWLWDRIRVRGGAYGAFCNFDKFSGVLTFLSYRDPNLL
ncbi:MAG: peptidase M16, partial [Deltaproteobacteria bacterium]|nr:peptidase M16 [Deltaproteobacteria bacterium]